MAAKACEGEHPSTVFRPMQGISQPPHQQGPTPSYDTSSSSFAVPPTPPSSLPNTSGALTTMTASSAVPPNPDRPMTAPGPSSSPVTPAPTTPVAQAAPPRPKPKKKEKKIEAISINKLQKIMNSILPKDFKVSPEAKEMMQQLTLYFAYFVLNEAIDIPNFTEKKLCDHDMILRALDLLGFHEYATLCSAYMDMHGDAVLHKLKEITGHEKSTMPRRQADQWRKDRIKRKEREKLEALEAQRRARAELHRSIAISETRKTAPPVALAGTLRGNGIPSSLSSSVTAMPKPKAKPKAVLTSAQHSSSTSGNDEKQESAKSKPVPSITASTAVRHVPTVYHQMSPVIKVPHQAGTLVDAKDRVAVAPAKPRKRSWGQVSQDTKRATVHVQPAFAAAQYATHPQMYRVQNAAGGVQQYQIQQYQYVHDYVQRQIHQPVQLRHVQHQRQQHLQAQQQQQTQQSVLLASYQPVAYLTQNGVQIQHVVQRQGNVRVDNVTVQPRQIQPQQVQQQQVQAQQVQPRQVQPSQVQPRQIQPRPVQPRQAQPSSRGYQHYQ